MSALEVAATIDHWRPEALVVGDAPRRTDDLQALASGILNSQERSITMRVAVAALGALLVLHVVDEQLQRFLIHMGNCVQRPSTAAIAIENWQITHFFNAACILGRSRI